MPARAPAIRPSRSTASSRCSTRASASSRTAASICAGAMRRSWRRRRTSKPSPGCCGGPGTAAASTSAACAGPCAGCCTARRACPRRWTELVPGWWAWRRRTGGRTGARIVPALAAAVSGAMPAAAPVHAELARAWRLDAEGSDLVRRCLVLATDHELNASTYVARCIASTGASPYAALLGALGALSGPRHGGETDRVETLLREALRTEDVRSVVAARLQRGERIAGFGHPLYPDGDPRCRHILEAVKASRHGRRSEGLLDIG